jgi:hypothetical protein
MTFSELYIAIEERRDIAVAACDKVLDSMASLDSIDDEIHEMHQIEHRFLHDETARHAVHFLRSLQEFADLEYEEARTLDLEKTQSIERLSKAKSELSEFVEHIVEKHKQIQAKIIVMEHELVEYEEMIADLTHSLSLVFADYFSHCIDLLHSTQDLGAESEAAVGEFSEAVSTTLTQSTFQAFSDLDHSAQEISNKKLPEASTKFVKKMDESFDQMHKIIDDHSSYMNEIIHDMMLHMMDYVERDSLGPLQDMFKKLNNEALVSMEKTMKSCEEILTSGSHTANAIKHWLPALMEVRETTVVVRESMDAAMG